MILTKILIFEENSDLGETSDFLLQLHIFFDFISYLKLYQEFFHMLQREYHQVIYSQIPTLLLSNQSLK